MGSNGIIQQRLSHLVDLAGLEKAADPPWILTTMSSSRRSSVETASAMRSVPIYDRGKS